MSILTRLRSDIWVDAYRRRAEIAGGYVTIRAAGLGGARGRARRGGSGRNLSDCDQ